MGSFVFTWEHPADEVYVTGTFDDWSKSERLIKTNNIFTKKVFLPIAPEKIYYKFVVDGNWVTDHTAPQENDESGNLNNVLTADRIMIDAPETVVIMSGVTADSSTTALAGEVPLEKDKKTSSASVPGAFPVTPAAIEKSESELSTDPPSTLKIPTIANTSSEDTPKPNTDDSKDLETGPASTIENEQTFSVSPLPAFPGAVNPISIAPGQKLPDYSTLTANTLTSFVDLGCDKTGHDETLTNSNPAIDSEHIPQNECKANKEDINKLSDTLKEDAPVTILPVRSKEPDDLTSSPFIQSVGPQSTTASLLTGIPKDDVLEKSLEIPPVDSTVSPDSKEVNIENKPDDKTQNQSTENTISDQITEGINGTENLSSSNTESKPSDSYSEKPSISQDEKILSDNSVSHIAKDTSEVVKEAKIDSEQNQVASDKDETVLTKQSEGNLLTGARIENVTGDSDSTTSPKTTADPGQAAAFEPHIVTTAEATNGDPETRASSSHVQDETASSPSAEINSTAGDKLDKKKKRTSIFGRLKARLYNNKD